MTSGLVVALGALLLSSIVAALVGGLVYRRGAPPERRVLDDGEYDRTFADE